MYLVLSFLTCTYFPQRKILLLFLYSGELTDRSVKCCLRCFSENCLKSQTEYIRFGLVPSKMQIMNNQIVSVFLIPERCKGSKCSCSDPKRYLDIYATLKNVIALLNKILIQMAFVLKKCITNTLKQIQKNPVSL